MYPEDTETYYHTSSSLYFPREINSLSRATASNTVTPDTPYQAERSASWQWKG